MKSLMLQVRGKKLICTSDIYEDGNPQLSSIIILFLSRWHFFKDQLQNAIFSVSCTRNCV
jgi:hypothetical protein